MTHEEFTLWVTEQIFNGEVRDNPDCFCELACRKLKQLGVIEVIHDNWVFPRARGEEE